MGRKKDKADQDIMNSRLATVSKSNSGRIVALTLMRDDRGRKSEYEK